MFHINKVYIIWTRVFRNIRRHHSFRQGDSVSGDAEYWCGLEKSIDCWCCREYGERTPIRMWQMQQWMNDTNIHAILRHDGAEVLRTWILFRGVESFFFNKPFAGKNTFSDELELSFGAFFVSRIPRNSWRDEALFARVWADFYEFFNSSRYPRKKDCRFAHS